MADKRYYWLKLQRDFFKRHDIMVVEAMPNGKDYVLFYLKLLCESANHEGNLRFSDEIPYNEQMLSAITNTNVDIVRTAIKIFTQLGMMSVLDDGTIFMREVSRMIGSESESAERVRQHRARQEALEQAETLQCNAAVTPVTDNVTKREEIEIESKERKSPTGTKERKSAFVPPTVDQVRAYCSEKGYNVDAETFVAFYSSKGWMVGRSPMKDWRMACVTWSKPRRDAPGKRNFANERSFTDYDAIVAREA